MLVVAYHSCRRPIIRPGHIPPVTNVDHWLNRKGVPRLHYTYCLVLCREGGREGEKNKRYIIFMYHCDLDV